MKKYVYVRAWCKMLGSIQAYTRSEVARAKEEHAPETAIFQRIDGTWATFEGIQRENVRQEVQAIVDDMERG